MNARKQKRKFIIANRVAGFDLHLARLVKRSTGKCKSALTRIRYARRNSKIQDNQQAKRQKKEHNSVLAMTDSYKVKHGTDIIPTGFGHLSALIEGGISREDLFVVGVPSPKWPWDLAAIRSGAVLPERPKAETSVAGLATLTVDTVMLDETIVPSVTSPLLTTQGMGRNGDFSIRKPEFPTPAQVEFAYVAPQHPLATVVAFSLVADPDITEAIGKMKVSLNPIVEQIIDGITYETRWLTLNDLSIKHHGDPEVADNDGWKRLVVKGEPTDRMYRVKP